MTEEKNETTFIKPKQKTKAPKWHRIYYLLAFFDVLIVLSGLFLNHHLISVQRESVSDNEVWVNRLDKYLALRKVANKVSQPGDDVFASKDSVLERRNMEGYLIAFNDEFKTMFAKMDDVPPRFREHLTNDLREIDSNVQTMAIQCRKVFDAYDKGDVETAGSEMATMDQMLGKVNDSLSLLHNHVIQIQHDLLTEESDYISGIQRYEFLTAAFVLLMVSAAMIYGNKVKKRMEADTKEKELFIDKLQTTQDLLQTSQDELEIKVEQRTSELSVAKDLVENIISSMADMLITVDDDGIIQKVNQATLFLLGYKEDEIIGKPVNLLTQKETFLSKEEFKQMLKFKKLLEIEKDFVCRNGKKIRVSVSSSVLQGQRAAAVVVAKDISKRLEDERKLRRYATKLEQSNRELEDFAYVASHDLQEPLRKVQAFGDRLETKYSETLSEQGRDYVQRMREAANRMQRLINDLLTFSRVTSKAQPFQSVDIKNIAEEVISDLEVRIEETKGKVEIGELPNIEADPVQIRQLMQNLIGNALKFHHPNESPIIKVYSNQTVQNNTGSFSFNGEHLKTQGVGEQFCQIVVQDNGIGFDEKYLDRIFTVFQRLHGRAEYEGSGVGLAVCRKIVERHGGTITAQSKEGEGAAFLINLPINQIHKEINLK